MSQDDRSTYFHKEWIGMLQPVGLVVEATALVQAQINLDRGTLVDLQQQFKDLVTEEKLPGKPNYQGFWMGGDRFQDLLTQFLHWPTQTIAGLGNNPLPDHCTLYLKDYEEILEPTYGVKDKAGEWVILVKVVPLGWDLDQDEPGSEHKWQATPQQKFERLLREAQQPVGLLFNGTHLRLVYAPRGEASGYLTFPVQAMTEVAGRLILGALEMLLGRNCLLSSRPEQRLTKVLEASRKAQALVSEQLASQVLDALWELLRGFESAAKMVQSPILEKLSQTKDGCRHIYGGLITTLMRLVFLLYAEERDVMPDEEVYNRYYSVLGLYDRLVEDQGTYPDTMDQRYGAWAGLLSLFRLVYEGGGPYEDYLPARHGQLFDPDTYPFLEGRWSNEEPVNHLPQISDGVVFRMLDKLLMLKGDRLSYRALGVEEIGSVYEGIMGFEVEVATGPSLAVRPKDVVVNLEELLATKPADRSKPLKEAGCDLGTGQAAQELKSAKTIAELQAALEKRASHRTLGVLPTGSLYLQPGEERRRSGSHYTPQKLTAPIVETTLQPIFHQLGEHPTAEQILELKVCDLAMGSGAFLVETCRQLADALVKAWEREKTLTPSPSPRTGEGDKNKRGEERWEVPEVVRQKMVEVARQFRKEPTPSEAILWQALRGKKLDGHKFRRQQPIGSFIVDFFCPAERLIVEIDGGIHETQRDLDQQRQELLESLGLRFIRLSSTLVDTNLPLALQTLQTALLSPVEEGLEMRESSAPSALSTPYPLLSPSPPVEEGLGMRESSPPYPLLSPSPPVGEGLGVRGSSTIDPLLLARRLVAQRCLYGVDKNPFAVNLAKLSLWLLTLSNDRPFTFLDHALKCGDSLVGLTSKEIGSFTGTAQLSFLDGGTKIREELKQVEADRRWIQAIDTTDDRQMKQKYQAWQRVEGILAEPRLAGQMKVAAFFNGKKTKERENLEKDYQTLLAQGTVAEKEAIVSGLTQGDRAVIPFNWELEFPEVFNRDNPGFDAIVGNPPFAGKNTTINGHPEGYVDWIKIVHPESHGNSDLVAHFFRRAFTITRTGGSFGLIATNTIAQGDTRSSGLRYICNNGGVIYNATRRYRWPGMAAVVVSVVHLWKANQ